MSLLHELSAAVIRNRLHIGRSGTCMHKTIQIIQIYTSNLAHAPFSNSPCANAHLDEVSSIPDSLPRDSSPQVKQTGYRLRHFTTHLHRPVAGLSSRLRTMAPLAYLYTVGTYNRYLLIGAHACADAHMHAAALCRRGPADPARRRP